MEELSLLRGLLFPFILESSNLGWIPFFESDINYSVTADLLLLLGLLKYKS